MTSSPSPSSAPASATLKVATYNIHRCRGGDGREDAGRVAAVLAETGAEVIGLQEVEARPSRTRLRQGEELARRLGMELLEGPVLEEGGGHYGNAILSRWPLRLLRRGHFPRMGREARGFLHGEIAAPGNDQVWHVIVAHLDLAARARSAQLEQLAQEFLLAPYPALLMGDLNEWRRWTRALAGLRGAGRLLPPRPSFPTRYPVLALDRIVVRGARIEAGPVVHRTRLSRQASDHLPVWALLAAGAPPAKDSA